MTQRPDGACDGPGGGGGGGGGTGEGDPGGGGGTSGGATIIWDSAGVTAGNVYATWAEVVAYVNSVNEPITILVKSDGTVTTSAGEAGGVWTLPPATSIKTLDFFAAATIGAKTITFADGAKIARWYEFSRLGLSTTSTAPVLVVSGTTAILVDDFLQITASAAAPFFEVGGAFSAFTALLAHGSAFIGSEPVVEFKDTALGFFQLSSGGAISAGTLKGTAANPVTVIKTSADVSFDPQPDVLGLLSVTFGNDSAQLGLGDTDAALWLPALAPTDVNDAVNRLAGPLGYPIIFGGDADNHSDLLKPNKDAGGGLDAVFDHETICTVYRTGEVVAIIWDTQSADATTVIQLYKNQAADSTVTLTGQSGGLVLATPIPVTQFTDDVEVGIPAAAAGQFPEKCRITLWVR